MNILTYTATREGKILNVMFAPNKYSEQDIKSLVETFNNEHQNCKSGYWSIDDELGKAIQFLLDDRAMNKNGLTNNLKSLRKYLNTLLSNVDVVLYDITNKLKEEREEQK